MIKKNIEKALNEQVNAELYSAYLYYSMANYFESVSLPGFANWMRVQAQEEAWHGHRFVNFINERGGRVSLGAIDAPPLEWESPQACFAAVYEHEVFVTDLINKLVDLALKESDHATYNFLQWFVSEQVEEEATADELVNKLKMIEGNSGGMFMMDNELAGRVFNLPADMGGK